MTRHNHETFERSMIPAYLKRDAKEAIEAAVGLGWWFQIDNKNTCSIATAEGIEPHKRYHFSASGRSTIPMNSIRRDIVRLAVPERLIIAIEQADLPKNVLSHVSDDLVVPLAKAETPLGTPTPEPVPTGNPKVERHIISSAPMVAKAGEHRGYTSETTLVRTWSDGTTDYQCTECEFSSDNRKGPSGHYANIHAGGLAPLPPTYEATVTDAHVYAPRQARIEALAQWMRDQYREGALDRDDWGSLAKQALTWVHEQSKGSTEHAVEREELTAEETLTRIRTLLDDGGFLRMQQAVTDLQQQVVDLHERVAQESKRAQEAWDNLNTFRALINEMPNPDHKAVS